MSQHETWHSPTAPSVEEQGQEAHRLQQAHRRIEELELGGSPLDLPERETVQVSRVDTVAGVGATVLRHRHNSVVDGSREDVYYALRDDAATVQQGLTILVDNLEYESAWIESGAFEKIAPRRDALARKTADAMRPEVKHSASKEVQDFMRVLSEAVTSQRQTRSMSTA